VPAAAYSAHRPGSRSPDSHRLFYRVKPKDGKARRAGVLARQEPLRAFSVLNYKQHNKTSDPGDDVLRE